MCGKLAGSPMGKWSRKDAIGKVGADLISSRVGGDELYVIQRMIALKLYDSLGKASNYYENISLYNKNIKFIY